MNALRSYPAQSLCAHKSHSPHFIHPSPALLFKYTSEQYKHGVVTVFFLFNSLFFAFVSFSWLSCCFSCNHYSVGARLILPSSVALKLPKLAHLWLKLAPGVPLWPTSTVVGSRPFLQCYDLRAYLLRINTKYTAYYHIAELSAHASIVNT